MACNRYCSRLLLCFCPCFLSAAERWRSPAAGSGRDAGADAGGRQVQRFDTY